jgi:hypothetical protein
MIVGVQLAKRSGGSQSKPQPPCQLKLDMALVWRRLAEYAAKTAARKKRVEMARLS